MFSPATALLDRMRESKAMWVRVMLAGTLVMASTAHLAAQVIEGRVIGSWRSQPVRGAVVILAGTSHAVTTGRSGEFVIRDVPTGSYELLVQHPGYHSVTLTVNVPPAGVSGLLISVPVRAIPLDSVRAVVVHPLARARRARGTAHHVYVTREELDAYELRSARHAADALRLHSPTAVQIVEHGITRSRYGPGVCIVSTRAAARRTPSSPGGGGCAAVFIDGIRVPWGSDMILHDLPLSDIQAIEFLPPADAAVRFGHAGSAGAVLITTRRGRPGLEPVQPTTPPPAGPRHGHYLVAGATAGLAASLGVLAVRSLASPGADEFCRGECGRAFGRLLGGVAVGIGVGELLWRIGLGR